MYGNRARIGLIVPSGNTVCEPEMATLCPEGVTHYATRILFEPTQKELREMKDHIERAVLELASENVSQIIVFCCTVGSLIGKLGYDKEIIDLIEKKTNTPAITTATAVKAALDVLNIKKVAIGTPYTREINRFKEEGLEQSGYHVTMIMGYHEHISPETFKNEMIGRLLPEIAYEMGLQVNGKENEREKQVTPLSGHLGCDDQCIHHLGIHLSGDPFCYRNPPSFFDGWHSISNCWRNLICG